jgi:hypothetical protein
VNTKIIRLVILIVILIPIRVYSQEEKYTTAIIRESDVPNYMLPDLLTSFSGKKITSVGQWETVRRPEIVKFFTENIYGKVPVPAEPVKKSFKLIAEDKNFMEGLFTKRTILVTFSNSKKSLVMQLVTFVPNNATKPVPAIYHVNQSGVKEGGYDLTNSQRYGQVNSSVPLRQLILRGIGLVASDIGELIGGDNRAEVLSGGILDLYFQPGQTNTKDDEWGMKDKLKLPAVEVTWYDGGFTPPRPVGAEGRDLNNCTIFHGTKDTLICGSHGGEPWLTSGRVPKVSKKLREITVGHEQDWIRACKESPENRVKTTSDFSKSGPFNEMVVMGVLAVRLQGLRKELIWDGVNMKFTNIGPEEKLKFRQKSEFTVLNGDPKWNNKDTEPVNAQQFSEELIRHKYREGWKLPDMPA